MTISFPSNHKMLMEHLYWKISDLLIDIGRESGDENLDVRFLDKDSAKESGIDDEELTNLKHLTCISRAMHDKNNRVVGYPEVLWFVRALDNYEIRVMFPGFKSHPFIQFNVSDEGAICIQSTHPDKVKAAVGEVEAEGFKFILERCVDILRTIAANDPLNPSRPVDLGDMLERISDIIGVDPAEITSGEPPVDDEMADIIKRFRDLLNKKFGDDVIHDNDDEDE